MVNYKLGKFLILFKPRTPSLNSLIVLASSLLNVYSGRSPRERKGLGIQVDR